MLKIGNIVRVENPSIKNQHGGATPSNKIIEVKITESWYHDDKEKYCYKGEIINKTDIDYVKKLGMAECSLEEFKRTHTQPWFKDNIENFINYEPQELYKTIVFDEFDICKDNRRKKARTFEERRQDAIKEYDRLMAN